MSFPVTKNASDARGSPFRTASAGAAAVVLIGLFVAALVFSNSFAARQVTDDAMVLYRAESTLGVNQLVVKALSQAVLLAEDEALGVANAETTVAAISEAVRTLESLAIAGDELVVAVENDAELQDAIRAATSAGTEVVLLLERQQVEEAGRLLAGEAKRSFEAVRDTVGLRRDKAIEAVSSTDTWVSRLGNLPAFFAAFFIPALAIFAYRRIAWGQLRLAEVQLDSRLQSEQQLLRAKDEFVANISHELRTPLTTIYGFSEILVEQGVIDADQSMELIEIINAESTELHRMVEDLLASARYETGSITLDQGVVDLRREVEANVATLSRAGNTVDVDLLVAEVWGDAARVRQILRNLISNAECYGGPHVRIGSETRGDYVAIVVADDGPGVPPEKAVRLFTRYVHEGTDPLTVGSIGLGLAVVRMLADAMGGEALYERLDGWTRFTVLLPCNENAVRRSRLAEPRIDSLPPQVAAAADSMPGSPSVPETVHGVA